MSPEEEMEHELRELKTLADEIMFILRGSPKAGTTGIVQDLKSMREGVGEMARDVAHLIRFKKKVEESTIDHDKRERDRLSKELEIQKLKKDSQLKTIGIVVSGGSVILKILWDYYSNR